MNTSIFQTSTLRLSLTELFLIVNVINYLYAHLFTQKTGQLEYTCSPMKTEEKTPSNSY